MARPVVVAILLAGGSGDRADPERRSGGTAKQFREVGGAPMWEHSLAAFERCDSIDSVVVVVAQDAPAPDPSFSKVAAVALGGPTRQASLGAGLACLPGGVDIVVVHDAARPVISVSLIEKVLAAVRPPYAGAISALSIEEAVKEVTQDGRILASRSRTGLWRAQTPQAFMRDVLEEALIAADAEGRVVDDCSEMVIDAGHEVVVVPGEPRNIKVTRPEDFALAESFMKGARQ